MNGRGFEDRQEAGEKLAAELHEYKDATDAVVYGLARGGVPVAAAVADSLRLPLDVVVVRKLGAPSNPELAVGAITSSGAHVINERVAQLGNLDEQQIDKLVEQERPELERQENELRGDAGATPEGKTAIAVDDGLATGASMSAAVRSLRELGARRVIVAVPVASPEALSRLESETDQVISLMTPPEFAAVGQWYRQFRQVRDGEVQSILTNRS